MSSLFNDSGCCGNTSPASTGNTKCKGCVCNTLNQLANESIGDICSIGSNQQVLITNKGTDAPLDLGGSTSPTVFTLQRFDPNTCCAIFTYDVPSGTTAPPGPPTPGRTTQTYITDCRSIAGITCIRSTT